MDVGGRPTAVRPLAFEFALAFWTYFSGCLGAWGAKNMKKKNGGVSNTKMNVAVYSGKSYNED